MTYRCITTFPILVKSTVWRGKKDKLLGNHQMIWLICAPQKECPTEVSNLVLRELEKTFTWIVKLRSSRETESSQAKTGRRMQAKERAWGKARKCKVTTKARPEAAPDSCSSTAGRSQDRWPPRACSNLFKGRGLYPRGHKKPLQGFKKETDLTRLTA